MHGVHWVLLSLAAQGIGTAAFSAENEVQNVLDSVSSPGQGWSQQQGLSSERFAMADGEHVLDAPFPKRRQLADCEDERLTSVS